MEGDAVEPSVVPTSSRNENGGASGTVHRKRDAEKALRDQSHAPSLRTIQRRAKAVRDQEAAGTLHTFV